MHSEQSSSLRQLDYGCPHGRRARSTYVVAVGAVVLSTGAAAVWCAVHAMRVIAEVQQVARSRPIDFDPSQLGMPIERAIPLAVLSAGVALVATIHLIRLINGRRSS